MADNDTQTLMVNGEVSLTEDISALVTSQTDTSEVSTGDILQQALQEASDGLRQASDNYEENVENAELPCTPSEAIAPDDGKQTVRENCLDTLRLPHTQIIDSAEAQSVPAFEPNSTNDMCQQVENIDSSTSAGVDAEIVTVSSTGDEPSREICAVEKSDKMDTDQALADSVNIGSVGEGDSIDLSHLTLPPKSATAPLGSSANPIQIIQQGNTYHSTQVLTQDQLQQIAHVLQQQQVSKALNNGGKAVLYNPATNTRIIYRVIYPSELNKNSDNDREGERLGFRRGSSSSRGRGRPRKGWGKRNDEEENKSEGPELSREEKEKKKKHRPRTRSGRISKPPAYMMKDYKRIHHLDFDEEPYDDSDGGYSDYVVSDEDGEKRYYKSHLPPESDSESIAIPVSIEQDPSHGNIIDIEDGSTQGVTTAKPRNYKCRYCEKAYIGRGGLARHFRLNPSHGNIIDIEDGSTQDENSNSSIVSAVGSTIVTSGYKPPAHAIAFPSSSSRNDEHHRAHRSFNNAASARRKARLRDFLHQCQDEELMEVVLPHLSQNITLWEFLLMKTETENSTAPHIPAIINHFESLLKHIQNVAKNCLIPTALERKDDELCFKIGNEDLARALNVPLGVYEVKQFGEKTTGVKRPLSGRKENTSGVSKKQCLDQIPNETLNTTMSDQILNDENILPGFQVSDIGQEQRRDLLPQQVTDEGVLSTFDLSNNNFIEEEKLSSTTHNTVVTSSLEGVATKSQALTPAVHVRKVQIFGSSTETGTEDNRVILDSEKNVSSATDNNSGIPEDSTNMIIHDGSISVVTSENNLPHVLNVQGHSTTLDEFTGLITENPGIVSSAGSTSTNVVINVPDSTMSGQQNRLDTEDSLHGEVNSTSIPCTSTLQEHNEVGVISSKIIDEDKLNQVVCSESGEEGGAVIRQLVLPDGQIIGTWSTCGQVEGVTELGEQSFLPNNVVILQNADGTTTLQVPTDQSIPLETLQALLAMDSTIMSAAQGNEVEKTHVDGISQ